MSQVTNTSFITTVSSNAMAVVEYLSKSMMSALPFIVCAALFRTVAVIMGEGMLGLWSADSEIYRLFYSWLYNAGYYFLPIYLGWAAACQLGCSEQLGMMLGGVLIAPDLLKLVDAASTTGGIDDFRVWSASRAGQRLHDDCYPGSHLGARAMASGVFLFARYP